MSNGTDIGNGEDFPSGVRDSEQDGGGGRKGESDDIAERLAWFYASRSDADGRVLSGVFARAAAQRRKLEREQGVGEPPPSPPGGPGSVNWTAIGPSVIAFGQATNHPPVAGRVTAIVAGPSSSRAYLSGANGGVWFTGDGGSTWAPLDDFVASPAGPSSVEADSLSVGSLAVRFGASGATDEVYAGTGEANSNFDAYFGIGIRHSTAGGAPGTWTLEATNLAGQAVSAIVIDPDDPTGVLAATSSGLYRRPTAGGATTWTQVTSPVFSSPSGPVTSLIVAGTGASKTYYAAFRNDKVYSSIDTIAWTALTGLTGGGRVALAAGESDPTAVYALRQDGSLYRLVGTAFQAIAGMPANVIFAGASGGQGWYDIALGVDPGNANRLYLVGDWTLDGDYSLSFWRGDVTGGPGSWTFPFNPANIGNPAADSTYIGRDIHADGHAFCFGLNAAGTAHDPANVWVGSDGGVWHSSMSGTISTFQPRNTGLAITEPTFLAQRADTDAVVFAGTQDNGTVRYLGEQAWVERPEGDGGGVAVDPNNAYQVMRQYVHAGRFQGGMFYGSLYRSADGGATYSVLTFPPFTSTSAAQQAAVNAENGASGFYGPIRTTPPGVSPTLAAFGTNRLWLTSDWGASWVTLPTGTNPYTASPPAAGQDVIDGTPVTAIAFASATRIYAATGSATTSSTIRRYDKTGAAWTSTPIPTTGLPAVPYVTALAVEDAATGTFYATLGGAGAAHCWYWDGAAWHAALPASVIDVPAHAVVVDPASPQTLYVGTDVGCWRGQRTGPAAWTWTVFSPGLPEAAIVDLAVHQPARLLRAATHGRGLWEVQLDAAAGTDPDVYLRVNYADTGRIVGGTRYPWVEGAADPNRVGAKVYHWMSADIKVRRPSLPALPTLGSPADYLDYAVNIGDYVDSTTNIETADSSGTNRIFVEVHNRALTPIPGPQVRVLLLLTDASAGLPALPANYATHVNAGDTTNWVVGTPWRFADPATPYRTLTAPLDVRTPQVVEFDVDLSTLGLPTGHDHVCAAAFVSATSDQITATVPSLDTATMQDKHIAHRNLHLVALGATPAPDGQYRHEPGTFLLDFHNAAREATTVDLVFDRGQFPGSLSLMLPRLSLADLRTAFIGFAVEHHGPDGRLVAALVGEWLERAGELIEKLGQSLESSADPLADTDEQEEDETPEHAGLRKIRKLDRSRSYVAVDQTSARVAGVHLPAGAAITAAVTVQAPPEARPGDRYRLDVMQRDGERIIGGSSYEIVVTRA